MTRLHVPVYLLLVPLCACAASAEDAAPVGQPDTMVTDGGGDLGMDTSTSDAPDATPVDSTDATADEGVAETSCEGAIKTGAGETCVGYGTSPESCPASCGQPYGYVCFGGPPPGFTGCRETRTSSVVGNNYCCPTNDCVAQPDRGADCSGVAGKPNRYQCPPTGAGAWATPPAGCIEKGSGASAVEKFYCCP